MSRVTTTAGVTLTADGDAEIGLYSVEDVMATVRFAADLVHDKPEATGPFCCIATAALLFTAAEAALRSPGVPRELSAAQGEVLRRQAREHGETVVAMAAARHAGSSN